MPVNKEKMANMKKEYGSKKGEQIYHAQENKQRSSAPTGVKKKGGKK